MCLLRKGNGRQWNKFLFASRKPLMNFFRSKKHGGKIGKG